VEQHLSLNTAANSEPRISAVAITDEMMAATLEDGRTISVPLTWSWRLSEASTQQRKNFEIIGNGVGIHWPDIDEDISAEGMLYEVPAQRSKRKQSA